MTHHELSEEGRARRRFLKQAGTVAWASPLIVTMMSRAANAQGSPCGTQDFTIEGGAPLFFCHVAAPCGTTQQCVPDEANFGPGNPCVCQPL